MKDLAENLMREEEAMKYLGIFILTLTLTSCTAKEVKMTDPGLNMSGMELHYKGKPFTGDVVQPIPFTDQVIRVKYKDGYPTEQDFNLGQDD